MPASAATGSTSSLLIGTLASRRSSAPRISSSLGFLGVRTLEDRGDLRSRQSIGIHFGTFQLTEEEIDAPPRDLVAALAQSNLDPKSFVTLSEGVTTIYSMGR